MQVCVWCATMYLLKQASASVFIHLERPAPGSLLMVICRVKLSWTQLLSMVSALISI